MFCKNCGQPLEDGALFCANCNAPVEGFSAGNAAQPQTPPVNAGNSYSAQPQAPYDAPQQPYGAPQQPYGAPQQPYGTPQQPYGAPQQPYGAPQQPYGYPGQPMVSQEPASMGLRVLCWFFPIVGIILYFVKKDEKPVYAKQCGKAALISIIVNIALSFVYTIVGTVIGVGMYY